MGRARSERPIILFVDDEVKVLEGLSRALSEESGRWDMRFCTSPSAALDLFRSSSVDVAVVDMRMPVVNGIDLIQEMRALSPGSIFLMLTGVEEFAVAVEAINRAGVFRFFTKPCPAAHLIEGIEEALDSAADHGAPDALQGIEEATLNSLSMGVIVADMHAHVLFMNSHAATLCAASDGLHVGPDKVCRAATPARTARLHELVADAARGGRGGMFLVERPKLCSPLSAVVAHAKDFPSSDCAVIYLRDPRDIQLPEAATLTVIFGLTPAEARITHALVSGFSLGKAADLSGVTVGTARNYLKQVFAKTGAVRQSELIRVVLSHCSPIRAQK